MPRPPQLLAALLPSLVVSAVCTSALATTPPISYSPDTSNLNSISSGRVITSGVDNEWVKVLGHAATLQDCAGLCAAYTPQRCRSFTRIKANTSHWNASLVGQCYGHVDATWLPLPQGTPPAADSGQVEWPCTDDMDCSLNGKCTVGSGVCECSTGWTGRRCETLDLAPVSMGAMGLDPSKNGTNMSSWGGSVHQIGGKWHMFNVLLWNHCGIGSYLMNSGVVHSVSSSSSVVGPYVQQDVILPPFAHEPDVVVAPTGELVMVSVSSGGDLNGFHSCQCVDGSTSSSQPRCNGCNNSCLPNAKPTLSVASSANGPWRSYPMWGEDSHGENPSIWITKNGSAYGMSRGGVMSAFASNWSDPATWTRTLPGAVKPSLSDSPDIEDPFIFQDENDNWHALAHSLEGCHYCGGQTGALVGTHQFSRDAISWQFGGVAYTNMVNLTGGKAPLQLNRRERPHLIFAEGTRTPVALSNSAEGGGGSLSHGDRSWTLVQPLRTKSSTRE